MENDEMKLLQVWRAVGHSPLEYPESLAADAVDVSAHFTQMLGQGPAVYTTQRVCAWQFSNGRLGLDGPIA